MNIILRIKAAYKAFNSPSLVVCKVVGISDSRFTVDGGAYVELTGLGLDKGEWISIDGQVVEVTMIGAYVQLLKTAIAPRLNEL